MSPRPGDLARLDATVHGRVQGVGFRYFVVEAAMSIGVAGWVANEQDGSVHCVAEGSRADLDRFLAVLREGPISADIEWVDEAWMMATGRFSSFGIRSAGHRGD